MSGIEPAKKVRAEKGFTLAEVLITLGIIGIVAAMTMPALVGKYKKIITVNKLKRSYNILSNVFVRAQADYGDIINWDLSSINGTAYEPVSYKSDLDIFITKYILPYLPDGSKYYKESSLNLLGYKSPIKYLNGSPYMTFDSITPAIKMNDGTVIFLSGNFYTERGPNGEMYLAAYLILIDLDGPSGKNQIGKDLFMAVMPLAENAKFMFFKGLTIENKKFIPKFVSRDELMSKCKSGGSYCGQLIQNDNWEIKDDYPW